MSLHPRVHLVPRRKVLCDERGDAGIFVGTFQQARGTWQSARSVVELYST